MIKKSSVSLDILKIVAYYKTTTHMYWKLCEIWHSFKMIYYTPETDGIHFNYNVCDDLIVHKDCLINISIIFHKGLYHLAVVDTHILMFQNC
jgi:hypothetical protein